MRRVVDLALTAAGFDSRVLIEGETGVGKEVIAKLIYRNSKRKGKPFLAVNCGAIPETLLESELFGYEGGAFTGADKSGKKGFFELADGGVLFLDEIGEISPSFQVKLLRALQENEIMRVGGDCPIKLDVQIIAATNQNLIEKVNSGEFRADLYYRLKVFPIQIPPLRGRKKDIVELVNILLSKSNEKYNMDKQISLNALNLLQNYNWPGNVRELENIIERLVLVTAGDIIKESNVRQLFFSKEMTEISELEEEEPSFDEMIESVEKEILVQSINEYKTTAQMEKALRMSRSTLNRKLRKYGLRELL
ncbi:MAG: sigma 54-interacting transcriptional regulator [Clostridiaceae bacterium]|nr:sigma 54-interacting transcriptional regulator [Clostridiaceae bacterium]